MAEVKVRFSLPYREGMESVSGFVGKEEKDYSTFPDEKVFGKFERSGAPNRADLKQTDAELLQDAIERLWGNAYRGRAIAEVAKQFNIKVTGLGGIGKRDKELISALAELTTDRAKIAKVFTLKTGKAITKEELAEILG